MNRIKTICFGILRKISSILSCQVVRFDYLEIINFDPIPNCDSFEQTRGDTGALTSLVMVRLTSLMPLLESVGLFKEIFHNYKSIMLEALATNGDLVKWTLGGNHR